MTFLSAPAVPKLRFVAPKVPTRLVVLGRLTPSASLARVSSTAADHAIPKSLHSERSDFSTALAFYVLYQTP